jgi:hypothetical protein
MRFGTRWDAAAAMNSIDIWTKRTTKKFFDRWNRDCDLTTKAAVCWCSHALRGSSRRRATSRHRDEAWVAPHRLNQRGGFGVAGKNRREERGHILARDVQLCGIVRSVDDAACRPIIPARVA